MPFCKMTTSHQSDGTPRHSSSSTSVHAGMYAAVEAALDRIRPVLRADGGDAELVEVDGDVAVIRLSGSCARCTMSQMSAKCGLESSLRACVPGLVAVRMAT